MLDIRSFHARISLNCASLLLVDSCRTDAVPYIEVKCSSAPSEYEAMTRNVAGNQIFYDAQRAVSLEGSVG